MLLLLMSGRRIQQNNKGPDWAENGNHVSELMLKTTVFHKADKHKGEWEHFHGKQLCYFHFCLHSK